MINHDVNLSKPQPLAHVTQINNNDKLKLYHLCCVKWYYVYVLYMFNYR